MYYISPINSKRRRATPANYMSVAQADEYLQRLPAGLRNCFEIVHLRDEPLTVRIGTEAVTLTRANLLLLVSQMGEGYPLRESIKRVVSVQEKVIR